jgi:O-antigen/teichoic acid export membrane protein
VGFLAQNQLSTFFIEKYCSVEQVGFFRLAVRMAALPVTLLPTAFSLVLTPAIAEQFGKGDTEKIKTIYLNSVRYLLIVALPLEVGMIVLARPIISLLYGAEYLPVVIIMQILLLPSAIVSICNAASAVNFGTNRPIIILNTNILFSLTNIGLNIWLIPIYGILGAAAISSVSAVCASAIMIRYASKRVGAIWPVRDTLKVTAASLIMGVVVYIIQSYMSIIPSLVLGVPIGIIIYSILLFVFRAISERDLAMLKKLQSSLPQPMKNPYRRLTGLVEKIVVRTKTAVGE